MNHTQLAAYCLSRKGASVDQPFGPEADVYKVMGKMFALIPTDGSLTISLKCDPVFAVVLRDTYPAVTAAYHFNKKHWNGVSIDGTVSDDEIEEWIDHSYGLVVKGLTRAQRAALEKQFG